MSTRRNSSQFEYEFSFMKFVSMISLKRRVLLVVASMLWTKSMCKDLAYEDVKTSFKDALEGYSAYVRPVLNQSDTINISISFYLMRISAVLESEKTLQSTGFLLVMWRDQIMQKSLHPLCEKTDMSCPDLYPLSGVNTFPNNSDFNHLHVPTNTLWLPDLRLHNAVRRFGFVRDDAILSLLYTGDVLWVPGGEFETYCEMDVRKFPFDTHVCHFDIGPWQSNKDVLTPNVSGVDLLYFEKDVEWQIIRTYLSRANYIIGGCCRYTIVIARRPEMKVATLILPTSLLSFIGTLVFKLPTESGERVSLSVSVTLALVLYLTIIQNILPRSVTKPSYFEILLCVQVVFNLFNVFINVINIYIYHKMRSVRLNKNSYCAVIFLKCFSNGDVHVERVSRSLSTETTDGTVSIIDAREQTGGNLSDTTDKDSASVSQPDEDNEVVLVSASEMANVSDKICFCLSLFVCVTALLTFIIHLII